MPQLIAMIIIVVGAMIYMFQTFGGTGDKIEGIAQKTSIITEINNLKNGLQLAMRGGDITAANAATNTLAELAKKAYFADQMNTELGNNTGDEAYSATADINGKKNTYSAISFGGEGKPALFISYLPPEAAGEKVAIRVQVTNNGTLWSNRGFLESQLATDLEAIAAIDRTTADGKRVSIVDGEVPKGNRPSSIKVDKNPTNKEDGTASTNLDDGVFTIYFKDMSGVTTN